MNSQSTLWVFGYGSLAWKPGFEFGDSKIGFIQGFKRRFWQGSDVHRGQPEKLGRVVTLIEDKEGVTWGRALQIKDESTAREYLDNRESNEGGYETRIVKFQPSDEKEKDFPVLVYIALPLPSNKLYVGGSSYHKMASEIVSAEGSCGYNVEYLANLIAFMKVNLPSIEDTHLYKLEENVRRIINEDADSSNSHLLSLFDEAISKIILLEAHYFIPCSIRKNYGDLIHTCSSSSSLSSDGNSVESFASSSSEIFDSSVDDDDPLNFTVKMNELNIGNGNESDSSCSSSSNGNYIKSHITSHHYEHMVPNRKFKCTKI